MHLKNHLLRGRCFSRFPDTMAQCSYSFYVLDGHTIDKVGTVTYVAFWENVSGEFMFPISTYS